MRNLSIAREWFDWLAGLGSDAERWTVVEAVAGYAFDGSDPCGDLSPAAAAIYQTIRKVIDGRKACQKYHQKCESQCESQCESHNFDNSHGIRFLRNSENAEKTERKRKSPLHPSIRKRENPFSLSKKGFREKTKMIKNALPPSLEDVREYCQDRQNGIDAELFFDYYESNGWTVNGNPIRSWKAVMRMWERRDQERATGSDPDGWGF